MDDPEKCLIAYLAAHRRSPWLWADDGDVLVWKDGTTIAFRQEIIAILEWLVPQGWPPFEALVYLLAAFRGRLPAAQFSESRGHWPPSKAGDDADAGKQLMLSVFSDRQRQVYTTVNDGLKAVVNLPAELRASWKAKATLAEMLFSKEILAASARDWELKVDSNRAGVYHELLDFLRSSMLTDTALNNPVAPTRYNEWSWSVLCHGFSKLPLETLELRIRTGLDEIPQPAPVPIPPAIRVRQVLEALRADAEHAGLAKLVRDFMAAIQLPRRLSEQDEMPIGGFADITNRGNPDRLLLSELAHDDLTLAVRIAVNEALYLRREPPAKQPPSTLAILLDSGVRLWGTPRVLATAVALALVAKSPAHEKCAIFRAKGHELAPVDLLSKEGVIAHLGELEPYAHPGLALTAFHHRLEEEEHSEAVLITHREVWADPDFQRELALAKFAALYIALVERDGNFALLRYPRGGAPLCEAQVDIEALFPPPPGTQKRTPLVDHTANPDLPLILSRQPFPLLISALGSVQKSIRRRGGGGACVMRDRRLLVWDPAVRTPNYYLRGARTIATELPRGSAVWLSELTDGSLCVVKTVNGLRQLTCRVFSLDGALLHSHDWELTEPALRVDIRSDVVFIICTDRAQAHDLTTGAMLSVAFLSPARSHGRYFLNYEGVWCVLSWNGQQLQMDPLVFLSGLPRGKILQVFHNDDSSGPWVLMSNGNIYGADGKLVMQLGDLRAVLHLADDGRRMLVLHATEDKKLIVDLVHRKQWTAHPKSSYSAWVSPSAPPTCAVRIRIYRLGFSSQGHICLGLSANRWCRLNFLQREGPQGNIIFLQWDVTEPPKDVQEFVAVPMSGRQGYSLKVAQWKDGRRAWLDSRGMLHLRCADTNKSELTLALGNEWLAAWAGPDLFWGNPFFIGDNPPAPAGSIWMILLTFAAPSR